MPKFQFPPQGGEKRLCLTLFCSMMMTVIFAVLVIYAVVIIYLPAKTELESNLQGPKMCTVLSLERKLSGIEVCDSWSSCEEWCLSIAGEKKLCLTLFCTMMLSIMSAVAIIYAIVIVYVPAKIVLESNLQGPKMCTTLAKVGNLSGIDICNGWTSCAEWCLSISGKECSHVWAATREMGTEIYWEDCNFEEMVDHQCNTLDDLPGMNCKLFASEKDSHGKPGSKDICQKFNNIQIMCESGICWNVSSAYMCEFRDVLQDIKEAWNGKGYCSCNNCDNPADVYSGTCPELTAQCNAMRKSYVNQTMEKICSNIPCANCRAVCAQRQQCFDLSSRKDPTTIGTDEFKNPILTYYTCNNGDCREIYDLTCERRCNDKIFSTKGINSVIFNGERIIMAQCRARSTAEESRLDGDRPGEDTLLVACTNVTMDSETHSMISRDCVNGTWFPDNFNGGSTNYSHLTLEYAKRREIEKYRAYEIANELDITIYNRTKLKINIQGCVNTLSEECKAFYHDYGKDGRNYTWRASYPCYYDPYDPDFVVINFNPDKTLMELIFFATIPGGIMILSCLYMCLCSRFIHTADDGHMRLRCCGKYVTGIGNVPRIENPRKIRLTAHDRHGVDD